MESPEDLERHEAYMQAALEMGELALASDETPVGCVFVHEGQIIGRGMNDTNASKNGTRHAEFVALDQLLRTHPPKILQATDLYVTVEPCIMCASALRQLRVRAVYYGCGNDKFGGAGGVLDVASATRQEPRAPGAAPQGEDPPLRTIAAAGSSNFREQAIMLLRRFYVQVNAKAPEPQKRNRVLNEDVPAAAAAVEGVEDRVHREDAKKARLDGGFED